ncbi:bifunctional acetate--CoA ligase family protein/GNAT family N-acetyltransferase [Sphingomonas lycopersici]|uniref:Bifunctional acetate--CoA ligase family protein/GNAT family N-acetyltransferase n=1 Tax=Sphingomonas lycopersici TaxID=2951807 RepID=A0AA41ZFL4_9SPHN|nr:bifunctional acetate--CoA ligase family protein/GNAT family N-acetyltransferase [Sphingomonas lycopersici]MCW6535989.1 bifunctional acetate--CoA ligase family protein/GNAT family N-acetyltransferase [Sphingomonas lycopersici]
MTASDLTQLHHPTSVAVIGASRRAGSVGHEVLANIVASGFAGPVYAVNPHPIALDGAIWIDAVPNLPQPPDLAIIACPAAHVVNAVEQLGRLGVRLAVVVSNGFSEVADRAALQRAARQSRVRLIGPNSLGVVIPGAKLNASFAPYGARAGKLAFLSQSGALITAMLDWAAARAVGFSGIVSMGDMADTDLADLIDFYAADPGTDAILIYVEGVSDARRFMSAARAATLLKPVIAIKAGRSPAAAQAALSHTGAMAGSCDVHAAAFRRAGVVMVDTLTDLLAAAQVLSRYKPGAGNRAAIVTNGGGAGVLAADALPAVGATLATLAPATVTQLDQVLPAGWSHDNPVDVVGDAHADRFGTAIAAALADPNVDVVLALHCPTAVETGAAMAAATIEAAARSGKPVLACWLGPHNAAQVRRSFEAAHLALFDSIDEVVRGLGYLHRAAEGHTAALRAPPRLSIPEHDRELALATISEARREKRFLLSDAEGRAILSAYGIPTVAARAARNVEEVAAACEGMVPPLVLKIVSPDLAHKSDAGGVVTDLPDAAAVAGAARLMQDGIARVHPGVHIAGFEIEPMVRETNGLELLVGVADDAIFGPVLTVGAGGKAVEVLHDRALELPPLDDDLARSMIARTRISALLAGYRDVPPSAVDGVVRVLEAVSTMVSDLPDIVELDINPLLVGRDKVIALDARVRIAAEPRSSRMAIRPMPVEWSADLTTRSGVLLHIRPVRPDDEALLAEFFQRVSPEDLRFRFLTGLREVGRDRLVAMTQIDYARTMHFLAFNEGRLIASAVLACNPRHTHAEVALSVDAGFKEQGVSWTLMQHVIAYARAEGIDTIDSIESADNRTALALEHEMGFETVAAEGAERVVRRSIEA